jgi:alcohol dehydrogenase class IV
MTEFVYESLPSRVVFGTGTVSRTPDEVAALGCSRVLVLTGPRQRADADRLAEELGPRCAGVFGAAAMHTPVEVTERVMAEVERLGADGTVAVGGGSAIGLGKAIALRTGLPQVAVPTTYAGSEMTPVLGETAGGEKTTRRTLDVLPETVIYDVGLTTTLPADVSATSGVNAMAHAVEALYAPNANPVTSMMAEESIRELAAALPAIVDDPAKQDARAGALRGAWLAAICLGTVGMALHHKLCHVLGGSFDLPHAPTHAVVLPHAIAYNTAAAPDAVSRVARALGTDDAASGVYDLLGRLGVPRSLSALGMPESAVDKAAEIAMRQSYPNPAELDYAKIRELLANAWAGRTPR